MKPDSRKIFCDYLCISNKYRNLKNIVLSKIIRSYFLCNFRYYVEISNFVRIPMIYCRMHLLCQIKA